MTCKPQGCTFAQASINRYRRHWPASRNQLLRRKHHSNCPEIDFMPVCGQLNAVSKPVSHILHKELSWLCIAHPEVPAEHELRSSVHRCPCPYIALAKLPIFFLRDVLFFAGNELPNLIALYNLGLQVAECLILIQRASLTEDNEEICNGVLCYSSDPDGSANGITFNKTAYNCNALFDAQLIHAYG